ncbi:uncharacterized protein EV420DRAFT_1742790 [Desarmillaria tabescens]|uniref:Uncharacterized protein n=1 Tax=Armillaria tabescens TaxID=1929756 RepID=A0AA39U9D4_ARMTA|nr:uncharacterized protein EV420DRAFT_1742790 [Desarmillaria tabescens]KAK0470445.1 hypothetical protein EV420DRAFT_1742790 [Desarmillaria tabescens]
MTDLAFSFLFYVTPPTYCEEMKRELVLFQRELVLTREDAERAKWVQGIDCEGGFSLSAPSSRMERLGVSGRIGTSSASLMVGRQAGPWTAATGDWFPRDLIKDKTCLRVAYLESKSQYISNIRSLAVCSSILKKLSRE